MMIVETVLHGIVNENEQDKKLYILNEYNCVFVCVCIFYNLERKHTYMQVVAGLENEDCRVIFFSLLGERFSQP